MFRQYYFKELLKFIIPNPSYYIWTTRFDLLIS